MIFHVSLEEMNRGCDGDTFDQIDADEILKPVVVQVHGNERFFEYGLTIRSDIDLGSPAIYQHWEEMFRPWPAPLMRHFGRLKYQLFGWIPDRSAHPLVRNPRSLVPLDPHRSFSQGAESIDKQVWFVYLPNGKLDVGIAFREGRSLVLSKAEDSEGAARRYPLSRVDLAGRVIGKTLFHIK
jgi:hypothetical protein